MRKIFFTLPVVLTTIISGSNFDSAKAEPYTSSSWYVKYYNSYSPTGGYSNYTGQGYIGCDNQFYVTSGEQGYYYRETSKRQDCY